MEKVWGTEFMPMLTKWLAIAYLFAYTRKCIKERKLPTLKGAIIRIAVIFAIAIYRPKKLDSNAENLSEKYVKEMQELQKSLKPNKTTEENINRDETQIYK